MFFIGFWRYKGLKSRVQRREERIKTEEQRQRAELVFIRFSAPGGNDLNQGHASIRVCASS